MRVAGQGGFKAGDHDVKELGRYVWKLLYGKAGEDKTMSRR